MSTRDQIHELDQFYGMSVAALGPKALLEDILRSQQEAELQLSCERRGIGPGTSWWSRFGGLLGGQDK